MECIELNDNELMKGRETLLFNCRFTGIEAEVEVEVEEAEIEVEVEVEVEEAEFEVEVEVEFEEAEIEVEVEEAEESVDVEAMDGISVSIVSSGIIGSGSSGGLNINL